VCHCRGQERKLLVWVFVEVKTGSYSFVSLYRSREEAVCLGLCTGQGGKLLVCVFVEVKRGSYLFVSL